MKNTLIITALLLATSFQAAAYHNHCADNKKKKGVAQARTTTLSSEENFYDLTYLKLDINLSNTNTAVSGLATLVATITNAAGLSEFHFELNNLLVIDSLKINGALLPVVSSPNGLRKVLLPATLSFNQRLTANIYYHGNAGNGTGFFTKGLNNYLLNNTTNITFSLSDQYLAMDWWPAKQSLLDKVDSCDLWFTVGDSCKVGSNGLLKNVTNFGNGTHRYEWKTNYPITYYLIAASVAPYKESSSYMHFTDGSNDSMLVQNYYYDSANFIANNGAAMDSTGLIIDHFSKLFGKYPFYKEKYGHCLAPLGGGMEHQTMTTLGIFTTPLIAHELGHQWWGDHVTYSSWHDIWLSEGFASYCEQLFIEKFRGTAAAKTYRTGVFNRVMGSAGGSVYVNDTSTASRIFDSRLTYDKGGSVAHMLRYVAPTDSQYFHLLRSFQQQYSHKSAFTTNLKLMAENIYGRNLDTFFNQWVYGQGFPRYKVKYNNAFGFFLFEINQTPSFPAATGLFATPLDVTLTFRNGPDTTFRIYNDKLVQLYYLPIHKEVVNVEIDVANNILNGVSGPAVEDRYLSLKNLENAPIYIYPNPTSKEWKVKYDLPYQQIQLLNSEGKMLLEREANGSQEMVIPAANLPVGIYFLNLIKDGVVLQSLKLMKQ